MCEMVKDFKALEDKIADMSICVNWMSSQMETLLATPSVARNMYIACVKGARPCENSPGCDCAYMLGER